MQNIWVYDLEQTINFHSCAAINLHTGERRVFVLSDFRNDIDEYYDWLTSDNLILIGYNNCDFDYQLLHVMLTWEDKRFRDTELLIQAMYDRAQIVTNNSLSKWDKELIPEWKHEIAQVDCYKIAHFDNEAKRTSLKWLEFVMRMENVQDLPFKHYDTITKNMLEDIIEYNFNDVEATKLFFEDYIKSSVKFRQYISEAYNMKGCMNANDVKLGVMIFAKELALDMGIRERELKQLKTERQGIHLKDCVLDKVAFESDEFNAILEFFKSQYITETKGVFSNVPTSKLGNVWLYCAKQYNDYSTNPGEVKTKTLVKVKDGVEVLEKLNVMFKGFQYDFGAGGIHGCIKPGIYEADDLYDIIDIDVASFYPNIAITNEFKPEHLGEAFYRVYKDIYDRRKAIPKKNPNNGVLKLALNGVFGKSNSKYSWLYDPQFTMSITINGQLLLCMLAERLCYEIDDITMLQVNTDGLTVKIRKDRTDQLYSICKRWEDYTKLELEYVNYKKMVIRDVNNYIGEYIDADYSPKYKGTFAIDHNKLIEMHKNPSKRVVSLALSNYFLDGIPVAQTVRQHINGMMFGRSGKLFENYGIFDYCIAKKATNDYHYEKLSLHNGDGTIEREEHNGKIFRYFVSNRGVHVIKTNGTRTEQVEKHPQKGKTFYLTPFNKYVKSEVYDINYQYYIKECNKIIDIVNTQQLTLL